MGRHRRDASAIGTRMMASSPSVTSASSAAVASTASYHAHSASHEANGPASSLRTRLFDGAAHRPRASRPWDNLRPVEDESDVDSHYSNRRVDPGLGYDQHNNMRTTPVVVPQPTRSSPHIDRLPHERFIPLLRTATLEAVPSQDRPNNSPQDENPLYDFGARPPPRPSNLQNNNIAWTPVTERHTDVSSTKNSAIRKNHILNVDHQLKTRIGNRSLKPLDVRALPPAPFVGMLPIPNSAPVNPSSTTYRHSIRSSPTVKVAGDVDPYGISSLGRDVDDSSSDGDVDDLDDYGFDEVAGLDAEDLVGHPSIPRDADNASHPSETATAEDLLDYSALQSFSLNSPRASTRFMPLRDSIVRYSVRGYPAGETPTVREPQTPEFLQNARRDSYHSSSYPDEDPEDYRSLNRFEGNENVLWKANHIIRDGSEYVQSSHPEPLSAEFSDAESASTFASEGYERDDDAVEEEHCPDLKIAPEDFKIENFDARLATNSSEKPQYPRLATSGNYGPQDSVDDRFINLQVNYSKDDDDDGDILDAPPELKCNPGMEPALRDLKRASVKAGQELVQAALGIGVDQNIRSAGQISRAQGEITLRSRYFRLWNTRYASVVDHHFFGAVLFLFSLDIRATRPGALALKNSKMIVLADTRVQEIDFIRRGKVAYLLELKTPQRKYMFACKDKHHRDYWLENFTMCVS